MAELLWSDPQPYPGRAPSKRGVGVAFGPDVTERFLQANGLCMYREGEGEEKRGRECKEKRGKGKTR